VSEPDGPIELGRPIEPTISSRHNPRFRAALALRDSRERRARGLLLIDGAREIARALTAGVVVVEAWVARDRIRRAEGRAALSAIGGAGAPVVDATPELVAKLAYGDRDDGIVAIAAAPPTDLARLVLPPEPLVVVIEGVEKPGNLGAVLRSADGAGADALIAASSRTDLLNPNAIRASAGTIFSVPIAAAETDAVLAWLRARSIRIVAARVDAAELYTATDLTGGIAIAFGSEADGLTEAWRAPDITAVGLPMRGIADSLNVSVSAAVVLYEARRQRDARGDSAH
jgi:TrmH family RNA methyltransferase